MSASAIIVAGGALFLLLIGLLATLLVSLRRTGETVASLGSRLEALEARAGSVRDEIAAVDDGSSDVAAALREHRVADGAATTPVAREPEA